MELVVYGGHMEELDKIQQAFVTWQRTFPAHRIVKEQDIVYRDKDGRPATFREPAHFDGDCCASGHYWTDAENHMVPRPDEKVCARERAWRDYVRIRDNDPGFCKPKV